MKKNQSSYGILVAALCVGVAVQYGTLRAQILDDRQESIAVIPGAVFEILAVHEFPDAQVSWVLTEDRTFLEAGRSAVFRVRLTKPGTYTLDGGVFSPSQSVRLRKKMEIVVKADAATPAEGDTSHVGRDRSVASAVATALPSELVRTTPPLQGDTVVMRPDGILTLMPLRAGDTLNLDADTERDSHGDGDPANDADGESTFFRTDGTPLRLWFASPKDQRSL